MDQEYLQNVLGSPYVNEGAFGQLKTKAAQAMGAVGAMAGHQIQNPTETKLRSLWDGFMSSLKKMMRDWENQVSPMFDAKVPLNEKQAQVKETLDELAKLVSPIIPSIGVRSQKNNPETYVKGSAYNRSTTSPPKTPTKLTEIIDEGLWDVAKRDVGLNKALGSNDPSTILDAYKNKILSLFQNFMKDAVKMTKITAQQIYGMLARMQPSKSGWQAAGNMQKVVQQLQTLQSVGDIKGKGTPPVMTPQAAPGAVPPVIPQQPTTAQPAPQQAPKQPESTKAQPSGEPKAGGQEVEGGGSYDILPQEYPYIILHAIRIIIATVKEDTVHQGNLLNTNIPLPTSFGGSSLTEEDEPEDLEDDEPAIPAAGKKGKKIPPKEAPEIPGAFIYNLHSKHNKYPGQPFSMVVKPHGGYDPNVPGLPGVKIEVIWQTDDTLNRIYVIEEKNGKKSNPLKIMEFYDDDVNSIAGATTPGHSNLFSVENIVQNSDPNAPNKLKGAPKEVLYDIENKSKMLLRALMAATARKAKEFKTAKGLDLFPLSYDKEGNVTFKDAQGKDRTIDRQGVVNMLTSDNKKRWKDSLGYFGYFKDFPGMEPHDTLPQSYTDAVKKLEDMGYSPNQSQKLLTSAWDEMMKKKPESKITQDDLVTIALKDAETSKISPEKPTVPSSPAFSDAQMALGKLGYKKKEAAEELHKAWMGLAATKDEKDITASDLIQAVVSGKKTAPVIPASSPVSKPEGSPPPTQTPTAPVSGTASGPAPSTTPTAPVSQEKPEPEKGQGQKPEQPTVPAGKEAPEQKSKYGKVEIKGNDLEWVHPKTGQTYTLKPEEVANFAHKVPKFRAALRDNPDLYNKYKDKIEALIAQKGTNKGQIPMKEGLINPFQRDNLLY